jgi:glycosyl transferase family 2
MTPITLVLPYYMNPGMLRVQYDAVRALPARLRELVHVVVVDDGSPRSPADGEDLDGASLQVYRIHEDVRWNQDAARNIGVKHAETNWVLLTDMDHLVRERTWDALTKRDWDPDTAYTFNRVTAPEMAPYKPHPNSWLMSRRLYNAFGGYDERFAGYYGTDADFRDHVNATAAATVRLKEAIVRYPRTHVPDASTTTYLRKQPEDGANIARIKAERAGLPAEERRPVSGRFEYSRVWPVDPSAEAPQPAATQR